MNCAALKELINSVFDGEVPVETIAAATHHIDDCADCHTQYREIESLRERVRKYADQIVIPANLEERVRSKLRRAEENRRPQSNLYLIAAACLLLIGLASFLLSAQHDIPQVATTAPAKQEIATQQKETVTLGDVVNHTKEHVVAYVDYSPKQLPKLSKDSGFAIKPMPLIGWQVADICICDIGTRGQSVAHITYTKMEGRKRRYLTCYQSLKNTFECSQMNREEGNGREVRCARDGHLAIAYTVDDNLENIFVAPMPVKDLVHIARGA
jgi:hypothetical protein